MLGYNLKCVIKSIGIKFGRVEYYKQHLDRMSYQGAACNEQATK